MVIDQGGDIIGPRKLREKYPNRVYLCFFRQDRKNDKLVKHVFIKKLDEFFEKPFYTISYNEENEVFKIKNNNGKDCFILSFEDPTLYIENLYECRSSSNRSDNKGSGTTNIQKIISFCKKFHYAIGLQDESYLTIYLNGQTKTKISLSLLYIFSTGESWYNKLGIKEIGYDDNTTKILDFINEPLLKLIYITNHKIEDFPDLPENITIQQAFTNVIINIASCPTKQVAAKSETTTEDTGETVVNK
jgi:vacuolar-type H+-ATPase subunit F/Vma7